MIKALEVAVVLSAVDRMSQVFNSAVNASSAKLKEFQKNYKESFTTGSTLLAAGTALALSLSPAINAYADLEDSSTRLKSVMLKDGAIVSDYFEKVNTVAIELGNKLPGTTADFQNMFAALLRGGVAEKSILEGVGKASAYLAVGLKVPYEEAARLTAKLKEATGVTNGEMLDFMDTIARVNNLGVETGEMQFAFSRSAGALKLLNIQGLEASKSIASVYAQLIKTGASGETVGTGMTSVFNSFFDDKKMGKFNKAAASLGLTFDFVDKKSGEFKGVENMIAQFDRLREFNPKQRATLVQALLGPGQDAQFMNTLINQGIGGYNEMQKRMASQATLNAKVDEQLTTLRNIWEASTGTFTNALASFGSSIGKELKFLVEMFGKISVAIQLFSEQHPKLMKFIGLFIAITGVVLSFVGVLFILKAAFFALNAVMLANPFILILTAVIAVALAIYVYWDEIVGFFKGVWDKIKSIAMSAWQWLRYLPIIYIPAIIIHNWSRIVAFLSPVMEKIKTLFMPIILLWRVIVYLFSIVWDKIKSVFSEKIQFIFAVGKLFFNAGKNIVQMLWNGIKAMASKPIEAMKSIVQKMRDFLPYSPAKEGPFRDLHRVKIIETIAQSMKPGPMLRAMSSITSATRSQVPGGGRLALAGATSGGGGVTIHYSPSITISGTVGTDTRESFMNELRNHSSEIQRMLNEIMERRDRVKY